ncbi:ankyrin [Artomyces pyxidatus]|uniref:Ankyrin n=1 Tax=Artomyces pyxidatus TaxID=48021 RepID=A0ACB8STS9_9AGAM|nr:ankyrin [Artomyces pyxidatus]
MPHSLEAEVFLSRAAQLPAGPGVSLNTLSEQARDDELELRKLFATDRTNARLDDIHVGLVDVFESPAHVRTARARVVGDRDADLKYVEPLPDSRRRTEGAPSTVATLDEFKENWATFTESSLSDIDWSNIVAAGECVSACVLPRFDDQVIMARAEYFHTVAYRECDINLFLWGLTPEEAHVKIISIFKAVRRTIRPDAICVRTKDSVAIHIKHPYRTIRFPLQIYKSPAEILVTLPVDSDCCAFDGTRVWANPRALIAMMRQCNTVDPTRCHPLYEVELLRHKRTFEMYIPALDRSKIDTTIYEQSISSTYGLARLLALEERSLPELRNTNISSRVTLRCRPKPFLAPNRQDDEVDKGDYGIAEVAVKYMPYGPRWDVKRLSKWIRDQYGPPQGSKKRYLHRHCAFVYTKMDNCFDNGCGKCPEPKNDLEREMQGENDKLFVRGVASFFPDTGAVHSGLDEVDTLAWSRTAHVNSDESLFAAISTGDRTLVGSMIGDGINLNARDCAGRMPLHYAILTGNSDIASDLVDAGARISAELVGGQTALHLAARMEMIEVVDKLLERSRQVSAASGGILPSAVSTRRYQPPDDDDEGLLYPVIDFPKEEDNKGPDILNIDHADQDNGLTPLGYAIMVGSLRTVDFLLAAGADPKAVSKSNVDFQPLALTTVMSDEDRAVEIAERLIHAGATSCTAANDESLTIFHRAVAMGREKLVAALLRLDPGARDAVNIPAVYNISDEGPRFVSPLVSAVKEGNYSLVAMLLAHGARLNISTEDVEGASNSKGKRRGRRGGDPFEVNHTALETAICHHDPVAELLIRMGADINTLPMEAKRSRASLSEWISGAAEYLAGILKLTDHAEEKPPVQILPTTTWQEHLQGLVAAIRALDPSHPINKRERTAENRTVNEDAAKYYAAMDVLLQARQPKTWEDHNQGALIWSSYGKLLRGRLNGTPLNEPGYLLHSQYWGGKPIKSQLYDELFEACWTGDDAKILRLCLPKAPSSTSLEISVTTTSPTDKYSQTGYTPLSVAVQARKWHTARLIVVICASQCPDREDLQTERPAPPMFTDPSARNTAASDTPAQEEPEVEVLPIDLSEVATRKFKNPCVGSPAIMLRESCERWLSEDGRSVLQGSLVERTIIDNDMDAFRHVLDLHGCLAIPVALDPKIALWAIQHDRPDILDEYIRRTGYGLGEIPDTTTETRKGPPVVQKWIPDYRSWRRRNVTEYGRDQREEKLVARPIVWQAVNAGATAVLEYMAGPRPLDAIREHLVSKDDERARAMRKIIENEDELRIRWGWRMNVLNESALTVAILSDRLDMVQKLFELAAEDTTIALHARLHFSHFNALLLAAYIGCSPVLVDYLLGKGSDVHALDVRGWNLYHLVSISTGDPHQILLIHFLKTLPRNLSKTLLAQQSKYAFNTPLHLACRRQQTAIVQSLVDSGLLEDRVFFSKDVKGSTPLHTAILSGQYRIVPALAAASPAEVLHMENGVGDTPFESAVQKYLQANRISKVLLSVDKLPAHGPTIQVKPRQDNMFPGEIIRLRTTVTRMLEEGTLLPGTSLADELLAFTEKMEAQWNIPVPAPDPGPRALSWAQHQEAGRGTYVSVKEAVSRRPAPRGILHIADTHDFLEKTLRQSKHSMTSGQTGSHAFAFSPANPSHKQPTEEQTLVQRSVLFNSNDNPFKPFGHGHHVLGARGLTWVHGGDDF